MRCFDREQAEEQVKSVQAATLGGLGSLVSRADDLDGAMPWLHGDETAHVRAAVVEIRKMIEIAREVELHLALANSCRRTREAARDEAAEVPGFKIQVR